MDLYNTKFAIILTLSALLAFTADQWSVLACVFIGVAITVAIYYKWIWHNKVWGAIGVVVVTIIALALTSQNVWINRVFGIILPLTVFVLARHLRTPPVSTMQPVIDEKLANNKKKALAKRI